MHFLFLWNRKEQVHYAHIAIGMYAPDYHN